MPAPARAKEPQVAKLALKEKIRRRAYELYLRRGNQSGSEIDDWLQAEREILPALARKDQFDRTKKLSADRKRKAAS